MVVVVVVRVEAPDPLRFIVWLLVRSYGPSPMNAVAYFSLSCRYNESAVDRVRSVISVNFS